MNIGVVRERADGEYRVAITPDAAKQLIAKGFGVVVESGAGLPASHTDDAYAAVGATVVTSSADVVRSADILCAVQPPNADIASQLRGGSALVCMMNAWKNEVLIASLRTQGVSAFALERIPRISRAQSMDILSSMASVAGYKAVLLAASASGRFFPMLVTAAGTVAPTKCLVIGAGVAGLQAIATARRLGAVVEAFDVRPAVKEQIESLGAKFVEIDLGERDTETAGGYAKELSDEAKKRQHKGLAKHVGQSDVIISTAAIPGKPAPKIITDDMLAAMKPGSVILDLAAETGGNTTQTQPGTTTITAHGVQILAPLNLPATMPIHASQMFAKNLVNFLTLFVGKEGIRLHTDDEILAATCVTA